MADLTVPKTSTINNQFTPDSASSSPSTDGPIAAPRATPAPVVDTGAAVDGYLHNTAQGAQANLAIAFGANPDYEAELSRLSKQTGVPIDSARKFPDQVKQQAAISGIDFQRMAAQFPSTAAFYQNQGNANVAHDDVDALQNVEHATYGLTPKSLFSIPSQGPAPTPRSTFVGPNEQMVDDVDAQTRQVISPPQMGSIVPDNSSLPFRTRITDWARGLLGMGPGEGNAQGAGGAQAFIQQYAKDNGVPVGDMRDAVGGMSEVPTQFAQGFYNSFLAGLAPDENGPAQTTAGGIASGVGNLAGFVAGAPLKLAGAAVERLPGLTHVAGESFAKGLARDVGAQATTLGLASAITATGQALDQSTPSAALATLGMAGLHGAEMGAVFGGAGRVLPDNTVVQTLARAVGVNALMDAIQGTNPLDNRPTAQKIFDYGLNTIFAMHGAGRATGGWLRDAARAETAVSDGANLQNLVDASAQSKLRERDPDTFRDFVAQANDGSPVQNVYVDGGTLTNALAQSGIKMADIERTMPDVAKQIPEALVTGGDVTIPIADYMAHLAGSKAQDGLMPHLKTDPEGMTFQEANEFHQSAVDQFTRAAQQTIVDRGNDDAVAQSASVVHDDVLRQLGEANRFTPDVNKTYAALVRDTYTAAAARAGVTPEAMYQRYPLRIAAEGVTGANTVEQTLPRNIFREDSVEDSDGKIVPGFHAETDGVSMTLARNGDELHPTWVDNGGVERSGKITALYERAIELAKREGLSFVSDNSVTADAARVYDALKRRGYSVERNSQARLAERPEVTTPRWLTDDGSPVFRVSSGNEVNQGARGKLSFADGISSAPSTITLNKDADLSTFTHELGHFQLEMLSHLSRDGALPDVAADFKAVTDWFGTTPEKWREMSLDEKRPMHEQFARGFEAYLFEGKAPSAELRGVFQKVRAWMVNVYRSLRALNVELSPEVRGVFDRLLATNDAIRSAEAERAYMPMFATPEEAGMTPEQFADYHKLGHEATLEASDELSARTLRDMRFADNSKIRALREIQKDVAAKRRETRAEVEAQVAAEPVYRAQDFLKKEKGADREAVAEQFGFSSADEMQQKLDAAEPMKAVIDAVTDQRMLEKYGDITDPAAMNRAANEAIHNEVCTRFIATELKALAKATGPVRELERAAREVAQNTIANKKVREISAAKYATAETRAAKLADAALRKGDLAEAAAQKRNQLLNNQLEKAARAAATEVTKGIGYLRKFDTPSKTLDPDYRGQIESLLDRFDLRSSTTGKDIARRESLVKWVEARTNEGTPPIIPEALLNEAYRKSYKDMTIDEMRGLIDSVRNIEHLGRLKQKLLTLADKREFNGFIEEAVGTIEENAKKTLPDKIESNQLADKVKAKANRFLADHRTLSSLLQQMDGKDGGFLWDKIVRPMNERGDWEARRRSEATKALREIFDPIVKKGDLRTKTFIPEINNSLSKEGRLAVALNWGNETNQRRVLTGDKWTPAQAQAILKTLSKEDWQFVQKVWDHVNTYWPEIAEKQYRVTGVRPEKVEAQSFINPHGETMRGGYYPIKYDPVRSTRAEEHEETATLKQMLGGAVTRATTRRGFTESRVEDVNRPVRKDLGVITQHVEEVLHDLAWHEWLIDTNRVLGSGRFGDAVRAHYGPEVLSTMKETAKSIALGDVASKHAMDAALAFLRKGTIVSRLGFNVISALKQFGGFGPTAALIGPGYMRRGLIEYMGSAFQRQHVTDAVYGKSDFMRLRGQTLNRDIREVRNQIDAGSHPLIETISQTLPAAQRTVPVIDAVKDSYLWMIEYSQRHVDVPSWLGAYRKGLDDFAGDEAKAVSYADQVVRDSQGSGLIADQPQIMRGGQFAKLFTTFYSALNAQYNLLAKAKGQGGVARLASAYMIAIALPSLYTAAVANLRGHQGNGDDWQMQMGVDYFQELLGNTLGMGVGVRELSSILQGFDYTGPTPLTPIADLGQFVKQAKKGEVSEGGIRAANKLAGDVLHYPAGLLDRVAEGYLAWQNGDASAAAMIVGKPTK
ncbi:MULTISPECIES: hypothetical protein [unclassified Caballeronia]|uniref:hypothetical protein n=1 Tax=unclassified Caballeronia TaxID=2646786 RepID=UPI0028577A33|nr:MULTISPECIES: hypothetical protein [unclassified Caballeronia]MDR5772076.1 hypothetical protein [Caballeronia sp. LZ002]MDR5847510.1 hypothetical protein [Caballeronia sp. LZ003]